MTSDVTGSSLLSVAGELMGINVVFDDRERQLGFAVPVDMIREVLPTLLKHGQVVRSWIGCYVKAVTDQLASQRGLPSKRGALVSEVIAGGPAAQAGLQVGDVVLSFDGRPIARHQDLAYAATRTPPGKTVLIKVWRGRGQHVLSLRPTRKPE